MGSVNRRSAISLVCASALGVVLSRRGGRIAAAERSATADLFVVGIFRLGDWFQANPTKLFTLHDAPAATEVIKTLNGVRVYLVDRREGKVFADGFPVVTVEGNLRHHWKQKKRLWEINVTGVTRGGLDTDNRTDPPTRNVNSLTAALWVRETDDGQAVGEREVRFSTKDIRYDLTGAIRET